MSRCTRWSSTNLARRCGPPSCPIRCPDPGELLLDVQACGVCRTDLHIRDGELEAPHLPLVLGHQIVARRDDTGERVGVPWLGWTCGECRYCLRRARRTCATARSSRAVTSTAATPSAASPTSASASRCPTRSTTCAVAPLLCAGLIGYRALRLAGDPARIGLYGFGASAHIVCQVAVHEGREVYAFVRAGRRRGARRSPRRSARYGPATRSDRRPSRSTRRSSSPRPASSSSPALRALRKGGVVVCAGIHMSRHPVVPLRRPVGRARDPLGREPHP